MLKKITAIFFLILFSFNSFGYRLLFDYLQQKNDKKLEANLDSHSYDESQLIELKIAVNVAYQINRSSYERCDGEIIIDGIAYKYVKRKLANDTLYLMCIPNSGKMRLEVAKNNFFKITNDLNQNTDSKKSDSKSVFKNLQNVYNEPSFLAKINSPVPDHQNLWLPVGIPELPVSFQMSPERPPDLHF
ncbi:MAG: hypothetical protein ACTHK0_02135 [Ginsengibacter sp.]